ncbi:replication protein A 32 kDa subunit A isoform X2 [Dendrobium catenatum]|uniref:replication protein A 32 kDa subunit A isoform X2 n=1 Tax=Dendrobium catenatum TaxID=906689 RepID=UPI0010A09D6B|nr:replication protein A 32 kDa subunit A isoform X2 [Dendrobium catenatum]
MLSADQFAGAPLFTGGAFLPSQSIDSSISPTKIRTPNTLIPMTAKQIIEAYHSSEDKPAIIVDGIELANVKLVGLVMNMMERDTEVSFTLDDGTGRIDFRRWANESSDTGDTAFIQNGIYVKVHGHLRGFQGKRHALAFSVQLLTDFNDIVLHFLECIHIHLGHIRVKVLPFFEGDTARMQMNINIGQSFSNGREYLAPFPNQFLAHSTMDGSGKDVYSLVLKMFQEPAMLASEHGLHVDELFRRLGLPKNQIMEAINYLVDVGHIYSTVDEYHFKSANNC